MGQGEGETYQWETGAFPTGCGCLTFFFGFRAGWGCSTSLSQDSLGNLYTSSQVSPAPALGNQGAIGQLCIGDKLPVRKGLSSQNPQRGAQQAPSEQRLGQTEGAVVLPWVAARGAVGPLPSGHRLLKEAGLLTVTALVLRFLTKLSPLPRPPVFF